MKKSEGSDIIKIRKARKGLYKMAMVVSIKDYKSNQIPKRQDVSTLDMLFNPVKRRKFYADIDRDYVETDDEKEIFDEMTKRRRGE